MPENIPELAVIDDFNSKAKDPDEDGVYRRVDYYRYDGTLYMSSQLSHKLGRGMYGQVKLSYYDKTGLVKLHDITWQIEYDVNKKIIGKKVK